MNCYDCFFFCVKIDKHLNEVPFCTRFNKSIPMSNFVYNFFCFDTELPYRSVCNEQSKNNRVTIGIQQQTIDVYRDSHDDRLQQTFSIKLNEKSNKRQNNRKKTMSNEKQLRNVSLYDF